MPTDSNAAASDQSHAVALPPVASPITTDLVDAIGWDIANELAAYVERMYPEAGIAGGVTAFLDVSSQTCPGQVKTQPGSFDPNPCLNGASPCRA